MKVIIVSQRVEFIPKRDEIRDSIDQKLLKFILKGGYLPVTIPNIFFNHTEIDDINYFKKWLDIINPDGILISGGNNVGEFKTRDKTEHYLLDYANQNKKPLLGICRGMQMISLWAGSSLRKVKDHISKNHKIDFQGKIINVNSYHNYAIDVCPKNFHVLATSLDGEIEAIRHNSLNWEGWMWHPEREAKFNNFDLKNFKKIFK
tara:strand:+ start:124 stop:735 length:612 start_codon:yes stop_codon:yes gene_type:complete